MKDLEILSEDYYIALCNSSGLSDLYKHITDELEAGTKYDKNYVLFTICIIYYMYYILYVLYTICIIYYMYYLLYVLYNICIIYYCDLSAIF